MKNERIAVVAILLVLLMAGVRAQGEYQWVTYEGNGHLYALTDHTNWAAAEAEAVAAGGYLAEINDVGENDWLASFVAENDCGYIANPDDKVAWIGLYYVAGDRYSPTSWRWTPEEPVTYWNPYEYDLGHYSGTHMYLCSSEHPDGAKKWGSNHWHDTDPDAYLRGIIEVPEPVTLSLLALGGLVILRRRRTQAEPLTESRCNDRKEPIMKKTIGLALALVLTAFTSAAMSEQVTLTFQEGDSNGYTGTSDTYLEQAQPDRVAGNNTWVCVDGDGLPGSGHMSADGLLRFDDIFGSLPNKIPLGSSIVSATLTLNVATNDSGDWASVHRLLVDWDETATWNNSFSGNGVDLVTEALQNEDDILGSPIPLGELPINVAASVQAWSDGDENYGWAILLDPDAHDGWRFDSSENAVVSVRPMLSVTIPEPATLSLLALGGLALLRRPQGTATEGERCCGGGEGEPHRPSSH